jgi:hypothetical protein
MLIEKQNSISRNPDRKIFSSDHGAASVAAKMAMDAEPNFVREFDGYSGVSPLEAGNTADIKQKSREEIQ